MKNMKQVFLAVVVALSMTAAAVAGPAPAPLQFNRGAIATRGGARLSAVQIENAINAMKAPAVVNANLEFIRTQLRITGAPEAIWTTLKAKFESGQVLVTPEFATRVASLSSNTEATGVKAVQTRVTNTQGIAQKYSSSTKSGLLVALESIAKADGILKANEQLALQVAADIKDPSVSAAVLNRLQKNDVLRCNNEICAGASDLMKLTVAQETGLTPSQIAGLMGQGWTASRVAQVNQACPAGR